MTKIRELSDHEKKVFRRLRAAFRRALFFVMERRGSRQEMQEAILRVAAHATKIGWLEQPKNPLPISIKFPPENPGDPARAKRVSPEVKLEIE